MKARLKAKMDSATIAELVAHGAMPGVLYTVREHDEFIDLKRDCPHPEEHPYSSAEPGWCNGWFKANFDLMCGRCEHAPHDGVCGKEIDTYVDHDQGTAVTVPRRCDCTGERAGVPACDAPPPNLQGLTEAVGIRMEAALRESLPLGRIGLAIAAEQGRTGCFAMATVGGEHDANGAPVGLDGGTSAVDREPPVPCEEAGRPAATGPGSFGPLVEAGWQPSSALRSVMDESERMVPRREEDPSAEEIRTDDDDEDVAAARAILNAYREEVHQFGHGARAALRDATPRDALLPSAAQDRKDVPLARGCFDYFPAALVEVARISKAGNDQHNAGQPIHWARGKSTDQDDCILRHFVERGGFDSDGFRHSAKMAWRALALLQLEMEAAGAPRARGAWSDKEPPASTWEGDPNIVAAKVLDGGRAGEVVYLPVPEAPEATVTPSGIAIGSRR